MKWNGWGYSDSRFLFNKKGQAEFTGKRYIILSHRWSYLCCLYSSVDGSKELNSTMSLTASKVDLAKSLSVLIQLQVCQMHECWRCLLIISIAGTMNAALESSCVLPTLTEMQCYCHLLIIISTVHCQMISPFVIFSFQNYSPHK